MKKSQTQINSGQKHKKIFFKFPFFKQKKTINDNQKKDFNKNNIFEIRNFNLWYDKSPSSQALFNINLDIQRKKVTALIGPSGCGKTTFVRCLNRMNNLIPHLHIKGNIYFDNGTDLYSKKINHIELTTRVGMIFQKYTPFPMSIFENVAYGPKNHGVTDKKELTKIVKEALIDASLWNEVKDKLDAYATCLSGGQQQRLCIARAIALKPEVLLMDEPTSGLDPIATTKIENLILKLKEKFTIVLVTHSMNQAQRVSDNTVFFYQGKIIEQGLTKNLFTNPKNIKTKNYILGRENK